MSPTINYQVQHQMLTEGSQPCEQCECPLCHCLSSKASSLLATPLAKTNVPAHKTMVSVYICLVHSYIGMRIFALASPSWSLLFYFSLSVIPLHWISIKVHIPKEWYAEWSHAIFDLAGMFGETQSPLLVESMAVSNSSKILMQTVLAFVLWALSLSLSLSLSLFSLSLSSLSPSLSFSPHKSEKSGEVNDDQ